MDNADIARAFDEIADILEILDGDTFRIRSFRRSAGIIDSLSFNVAEAVREDPKRLKGVSGIGEGTVERIREIVEEGQTHDRKELLKKVPVSLLSLLRISGMGPKKVALVWRELGVKTIQDLEAVARAQRLRHLHGMGEKTEEKILKAIGRLRSSEKRYRLDDARESADKLMDYLRKHISVTRIAVAGSTRRWSETIGDIDLLVSCDSPAQATQAFVEHPDIRQVLAHGETKASVVLRRGLQVDLRVVEDDCFGAALQYFTGSKDHNVVLRERAKKAGYKISEYGLFRISDDKKLAGKDEDEIYRILGLEPMPPELRLNRGEIEYAEKGEFPRLIQDDDILGDLHIHTADSDGRDSIEDMVRAALECGYRYIAITDHARQGGMPGGLDADGLRVQAERIGKLQGDFQGLQILTGVEVDIQPDGTLSLPDEILSELDVVVAAVHNRLNMSREEMTSRLCRALENPHVQILGHPTCRLLTQRDPCEMDIEKVIRTAADNRVCLELNADPSRLDLSDVHCSMAREMGARLVIDTDAHDSAALRYMTYGVHTARRGWVRPEDVVNALPLKDLRGALGKK